jgi:hypothetical protein
LDRTIRWYRSARRRRIGKAHPLHVILTTTPVPVPADAASDDRGTELKVVALDLPDAVVVIHVMPTASRR